MSLEFVGGSSEYHQTATFWQLAYPYSWGLWVQPRINVATMAIVSLSNGVVGGSYAMVARPTNDVGYTFSGTEIFAGTNRLFHDALRPPWVHVLGVCHNATTHRLYYGGVCRAHSSVDEPTPDVSTTLRVGAFAVTNFRYYTGLVEGLTFWNAALSEADAMRLAKRTHPLNIARGRIIACYADMGAKAGTTVEDIVGGYHLATVGGTPNWNPDSPRMVYVPQRSYFYRRLPLGAGAANRTWTPSGGLSLSGAVGAVRTKNYAPSGGLVLGGTPAYARGKIQTPPSGGLTFGGAVVPVRGRPYPTPSGGIVFGGAVGNTRGHPYSPAGGLVFSGAVGTVRAKTYAPAGGLILGGAVTDWAGHAAGVNQATWTPSGGLVFGGAVPFVRSRAFPVSGGLTLGGAVVATRKRQYDTPVGGIVFGGTVSWVTHSASVTWTPAGGLVFSGASPYSTSAGSANFVAGTQVQGDGTVKTTYLADNISVPGGAAFVHGIAHASTGHRYVCPWPASMGVTYMGGRAIRVDGAQIVASSMVTAGYYSGFALSYRGEMLIDLSVEGLFKDGLGIRSTGALPVSQGS